jgi:hypothetical protein
VRRRRADWNFADLGMKQTQASVHFFHHWTAKFIPQIPRQAIELYGKPGDVVLDPFMGCGTTLVEAARLGHDSWGTDINPLAVKIARAKTAPVNHATLTDFIAWLEVAAARPERHLADTAALFDGSEDWFREDVARAIRAIRTRARRLDANTGNLVLVGLSDLLKGMSNARMDRTLPSLPKTAQYKDKKHYWRVVDNETRAINPFSRLKHQLVRMQGALAEFRAEAKGRTEPLLHDARDLASLGRRAQLAVTSPPYWSAQNYQGMHKLSFWVLGMEEPRFGEIGRHAPRRDPHPELGQPGLFRQSGEEGDDLRLRHRAEAVASATASSSRLCGYAAPTSPHTLIISSNLFCASCGLRRSTARANQRVDA